MLKVDRAHLAHCGPLDFSAPADAQNYFKSQRYLGEQLSLARTDQQKWKRGKWLKFIVMYKYSRLIKS